MSRTNLCSLWTRSVIRASRWRSSPPTTPIPLGARWGGSRSSTRSCPRSPTLGKPSSIPSHPTRPGDADAATAEVVVVGEYEVGMQDQAFLGPESGLAVPAADGGVDLYVATQWLHVDRSQIAPCLGLPEEKVRLTLAGVGGAFGSRGGLHLAVHDCVPGRPARAPRRDHQ